MKMILILTALTSFNLTHAEDFKWEIRNSTINDYRAPCVLKPNFMIPRDYKVPSMANFDTINLKPKSQNTQKEEILKKLMDHLSKIIDLKSKVTVFLEENRETYGSYVSLKEQKELLTKRIPILQQRRERIITQYGEDLALINPELSNRKIQKVIDALTLQRDQELERIDSDLVPDKNNLTVVENNYFSTLAVWAPYKEYLNQLENLENNLMKSLRALKALEEESVTSSNSATRNPLVTNFNLSGLVDLGSSVTTRTGYNSDGTVKYDWLKKLRNGCP